MQINQLVSSWHRNLLAVIFGNDFNVYIYACFLFVYFCLFYKIYMPFSHESPLILTEAILSWWRKIDNNERNKGRNSDTLKIVYSIGHIFTAWCEDKKKPIVIKQNVWS